MAENNELISIIVPFLNAENTLSRCVDGILAQTYRNIEIILVNNNSTDGSVKIAESYVQKDERVELINCDTQGLSEARNAGIEKAKGELLSFVDSDDTVREDMISLLYKKLIENDADISMGTYSLVKEDGTVITTPGLKETVLASKEAIHMFFQKDARTMNFAWAKLYRKNVFKDVRYPEGKIYEELIILPELIENCGRFVSFNEPIYSYIQRSGSLSRTKDYKKQLDGLRGRLGIAEFYERAYPRVAPYAYDATYEMIFYLMGVMSDGGKKQYPEVWQEIVSSGKKIKNKAAKEGLSVKLGCIMFSISQTLAGKLFRFYSISKNKVKP